MTEDESYKILNRHLSFCKDCTTTNGRRLAENFCPRGLRLLLNWHEIQKAEKAYESQG